MANIWQKIFNPGKSDKRAANRMMDRMGEFTGGQMQQYQQAVPQYNEAVNFLQQQAGLGPQPMSNDVMARRRGMTIPQQDPNLGIWNNPTDRFRMGQAQDDIDRYTMQQGNQMRHLLGQRGMLDSSVTGGAMQRLASDAMREYAGARRDLAISAPQEQERRIAMFMQALAPMLNMGQQSFQNYGQLAGTKMQQAQAANSVLPQLFGLAAQAYGMGGFGGGGGGVKSGGFRPTPSGRWG
jgi:hypothetical protein